MGLVIPLCSVVMEESNSIGIGSSRSTAPGTRVELIVLVGPPCVGKTAWAREYVRGQEIEVVNVNDELDSGLSLHQVHLKVISRLNQGQRVILDDDHGSKSLRMNLIKAVRNGGTGRGEGAQLKVVTFVPIRKQLCYWRLGWAIADGLISGAKWCVAENGNRSTKLWDWDFDAWEDPLSETWAGPVKEEGWDEMKVIEVSEMKVGTTLVKGPWSRPSLIIDVDAVQLDPATSRAWLAWVAEWMNDHRREAGVIIVLGDERAEQLVNTLAAPVEIHWAAVGSTVPAHWPVRMPFTGMIAMLQGLFGLSLDSMTCVGEDLVKTGIALRIPSIGEASVMDWESKGTTGHRPTPSSHARSVYRKSRPNTDRRDYLNAISHPSEGARPAAPSVSPPLALHSISQVQSPHGEEPDALFSVGKRAVPSRQVGRAWVWGRKGVSASAERRFDELEQDTRSEPVGVRWKTGKRLVVVSGEVVSASASRDVHRVEVEVTWPLKAVARARCCQGVCGDNDNTGRCAHVAIILKRWDGSCPSGESGGSGISGPDPKIRALPASLGVSMSNVSTKTIRPNKEEDEGEATLGDTVLEPQGDDREGGKEREESTRQLWKLDWTPDDLRKAALNMLTPK